MKELGVAAVALLLVQVGPSFGRPPAAQLLWSVGLVLVLAHALQQAAGRLRLGCVTAWLLAGLLAGHTGLRLVRPLEFPPLLLAWKAAAVWVGFVAGAHLPARTARTRIGWRARALLGGVTFVAAGLGAAVLVLAAGLPWWVAVPGGALASLWGPFSLVPRPARSMAVRLAATGTIAALLLLGFSLSLLGACGRLHGAATGWCARLLLSALLGAAGGAALRWAARLGLGLPAQSVGAGGMVLAATALIERFGLFALPCGCCAGVMAAGRHGPARRLLVWLQPVSLAAFMLCFGLFGAAVDLRSGWAPQWLVARAVLLLAVVGVIARTAGPAVAARDADRQGGDGWRSCLPGWLLVPRGALLAELCFHPQHSVLPLFAWDSVDLLRSILLGDVVVSLLLLSSLAHRVERRPALDPAAAAATAPAGTG